MAEPSSLTPGADYSWEDLGEMFGFKPNYLSAVGGMVPRPDHDALLLMTHPGGARSIDYGDYWEGDELVYTGRGKKGDQERTGANRDLGDNTKDTYVFEPAGPRQLHFLGRATTVDEWTARHPDEDGNDRDVLRFRLRFQGGPSRTSEPGDMDGPVREVARTPRPFDASRPPRASILGEEHRTREEAHALREKAAQGHHQLLADLEAWLKNQGWSKIEEIPSAVDLWAQMPDGNNRVIFEAKTVRIGSEGPRIRSAIAQLLEYRFFYGDPDDRLCVVCDKAISDRRARLLDGLQIAVIYRDGDAFASGSAGTRDVVRVPAAA
jgi:hypothetical protein